MKDYITKTFKNFLGTYAKCSTFDYKKYLMCYACFIPETAKHLTYTGPSSCVETDFNLKDAMIEHLVNSNKATLYDYVNGGVIPYRISDRLVKYKINDESLYSCNRLYGTSIDTIVSNSMTNETRCYEEAFNESVSAHLGESSWFSNYYDLMYKYEHDASKPKNTATKVTQYIDSSNHISSGYSVDEYRKYGVKRTKLVNDKVFLKYNNIELAYKSGGFKANVFIIAINEHLTHEPKNDKEFSQCYPVVVIDTQSTFASFDDVFKIQANANGMLYAL